MTAAYAATTRRFILHPADGREKFTTPWTEKGGFVWQLQCFENGSLQQNNLRCLLSLLAVARWSKRFALMCVPEMFFQLPKNTQILSMYHSVQAWASPIEGCCDLGIWAVCFSCWFSPGGGLPGTASEKDNVNTSEVFVGGWGGVCHLVSSSGEVNLVLTVSFDLIGKTRNDTKRKITVTPFLRETRLSSNAITEMARRLLLSPECSVELSECVTELLREIEIPS